MQAFNKQDEFILYNLLQQNNMENTVWRETLVAGKFGKFVAKIYWRKKSWRILSILRPKIMQRNYSIIFETSSVANTSKHAFLCHEMLNINAVASYMDSCNRVKLELAIATYV